MQMRKDIDVMSGSVKMRLNVGQRIHCVFLKKDFEKKKKKIRIARES